MTGQQKEQQQPPIRTATDETKQINTSDTHRSATSLARVAEAAMVASVVTKAVLHPIDTFKIRWQAEPLHKGQEAGRLGSFVNRWRGYWTPRQLYRGLPIKLVLYAPYQGSYMASYTATRDFLILNREGQDAILDEFGTQSDGEHMNGSKNAMKKKEAPKLSSAEVLCCALAAEMGSAFVRVPMEVIKIRVQCGAYRHTGSAIASLFRSASVPVGAGSGASTALLQSFKQRAQQGLLLFRAETLIYDLPYSCVQWLSYETIRPELMRRLENFDSGWHEFDAWVQRNVAPAVAGGVSGFLAAAVTVPSDVIRTRLILAGHGARSAFPASSSSQSGAGVAEAQLLQRKTTVAGTLQDIIKNEGITALGRGASLRLLWVSTNMSLYFTIYEALKRWGLR